MAQISLFQYQVEARDQEAESASRGVSGWPLEKVVFVIIIGLAYVVAVVAAACPIVVWLN